MTAAPLPPSSAPSAPLDAQAVADYLRENPEFFDQHAAVFAEMRVPHPYEGRAISLGERQILTLRERMHALERKLGSLTHHANDNQRIVLGMREWSVALLAESDAQALPALVSDGLAKAFDLPQVALRLWQCPAHREPAEAEPVSDDIRLFAASLKKPYCGPDNGVAATAWLGFKPASLALIPVRTPRGQTFGLMVLGSDDPGRFSPDMGTDFLEHIGALAGAALSRLLQGG
ncbi:DUF484 family protein [Verticiella sediminum]|uniref:DUF484 family protein n=1 Tax=Verticiella sediminum TaxID=1247510 RepID=A0A556AAZ0_9BURK|nr:DUF484 family protein [Verticiella sediminum]TSH90066.1 DUF484 family protein [Verticiella sediminum]